MYKLEKEITMKTKRLSILLAISFPLAPKISNREWKLNLHSLQGVRYLIKTGTVFFASSSLKKTAK